MFCPFHKSQNLNGILKEFPHAYGLLYITIVLHVINMWIFITHEHGIQHGYSLESGSLKGHASPWNTLLWNWSIPGWSMLEQTKFQGELCWIPCVHVWWISTWFWPVSIPFVGTYFDINNFTKISSFANAKITNIVIHI